MCRVEIIANIKMRSDHKRTWTWERRGGKRKKGVAERRVVNGHKTTWKIEVLG